MKEYTPGLFDRLLGLPQRAGPLSRISLEDMKDAVARDLEALLNTRSVLPAQCLKAYPECAASMVA